MTHGLRHGGRAGSHSELHVDVFHVLLERSGRHPTCRYIGEGFDDARLDTLFLTLPVSWRGTIAKYAGRLHRLYEGKRGSTACTTPLKSMSRCRPACSTVAIPGSPVDVVLLSDPYGGSFATASMSASQSFVHAARPAPSNAEGAARSRSASEAFLFRRLETLTDINRRFRLNVELLPDRRYAALAVPDRCGRAGRSQMTPSETFDKTV